MEYINETDIILTADDEDPICNRCDNQECEYLCNYRCGPWHGWNGYERTIGAYINRG